jgi:hypothetical protein
MKSPSGCTFGMDHMEQIWSDDCEIHHIPM